MNQPKPGHMNYTDLINDIKKGLLKIPQFQREFVWSREQAANLIDSILKGYPIGTFILWKTKDRLRSIKNIGKLDLPDPPNGDFVNYVLDGQQRMTSIFVSLIGAEVERDNNKKDDFSQIYIDLDAENDDKIVIIDISKKEEGSYVSVTKLINEKGFKLFKEYDEKYHDKIEQYLENIKTYEFSTITVSDVPIEVATEIFTRINIGGKDLTVFEIMCAKVYNESPEFDLYKNYNKLIEELQVVNYETISSSTLLQAISICLVKECSKKAILRLEKNKIIEKWDEIIDAFKEAVDYIRGYYRIPVSILLPYDSLLIPYTYFFYKKKHKPVGVEQKQLQDYFWRVILNSRFSSGTEAIIAQDLKNVIDKIIEGKEPEKLEAVNISPDNISFNGWFSVGRAYIKGLLCLLASKQPESFIDGSLVNINNAWLKVANSKNYHHFFPKAYLRKRGVEDFYINHIANITIVDDFLNKKKIKDKAPSIYMKEFSDLNENIDKTMKTHLINDMTDFGVFEDNYYRFFQHRIKAFSNELQKRLILTDKDIVK